MRELTFAELFTGLIAKDRLVEATQKLELVKSYLGARFTDEELMACRVSTLVDLIGVVKMFQQKVQVSDSDLFKEYVRKLQMEGYNVMVGEAYQHLLK